MYASADRGEIHIDKDHSMFSINKDAVVFSSIENFSGVEAYQRMLQGQVDFESNKTSEGFSEKYFWVYFLIKNPYKQKLILELNNPHIDNTQLFEISNNSVTSISKTGDHLPFFSRPIINRRFVFQLSDQAETAYLLKVDKRFASVSFPLNLWRLRSFQNVESKSNLSFGIYFGILIFIAIVSFFVGIGLPDKLFISYSIYVLLISLYIFTQLGFSFEFFYPNIPVINSSSRVVLAVLLGSSAIDFFGRLLNIKTYLPLMHKAHLITIFALFVMLFAWLIIKQIDDQYYYYTIPLLNVLYLILIGFICSIIYVLIVTWKNQRNNAFLFTLAFTAIILGAFLYILIEYGAIPETLFPINPIMVGSILEILILSFAMIYRIKELNDNKNELTFKVSIQQKELMRAFVRGGENERKMLSAELHDNIGSNLSLLKRKIESGSSESEELKKDIDLLCDDVRELSHRLIPHSLNVIGLAKSIALYCDKFQKNTGVVVNLDVYDFPIIGGDLSLHLFRLVQEALHNIEKHAKATEIDIQLIGYENEIVLTIDDDGVGFDFTSDNKKGLGLETMKSRVNAFDGIFEIASYSGKGTNILVKIPVDLSSEPKG